MLNGKLRRKKFVGNESIAKWEVIVNVIFFEKIDDKEIRNVRQTHFSLFIGDWTLEKSLMNCLRYLR